MRNDAGTDQRCGPRRMAAPGPNGRPTTPAPVSTIAVGEYSTHGPRGGGPRRHADQNAATADRTCDSDRPSRDPRSDQPRDDLRRGDHGAPGTDRRRRREPRPRRSAGSRRPDDALLAPRWLALHGGRDRLGPLVARVRAADAVARRAASRPPRRRPPRSSAPAAPSPPTGARRPRGPARPADALADWAAQVGCVPPDPGRRRAGVRVRPVGPAQRRPQCATSAGPRWPASARSSPTTARPAAPCSTKTGRSTPPIVGPPLDGRERSARWSPTPTPARSTATRSTTTRWARCDAAGGLAGHTPSTRTATAILDPYDIDDAALAVAPAALRRRRRPRPAAGWNAAIGRLQRGRGVRAGGLPGGR